MLILEQIITAQKIIRESFPSFISFHPRGFSLFLFLHLTFLAIKMSASSLEGMDHHQKVLQGGDNI